MVEGFAMFAQWEFELAVSLYILLCLMFCNMRTAYNTLPYNVVINVGG